MRSFRFPYRSNVILTALLLITLSNIGCTQTKSYWILSNVYRINREPMMGMTLSYMEDLSGKNTFLVKTGGLLHVDYPEKSDFNIDTVKSITYSRIQKSEFSKGLSGKLIDSIYNISNSADTLKIKFYYGGSEDDNDRFLIEYEKVSEAEYYKELKAEELAAKSRKDAVEAVIKAYKFDPSWKTASHEPLKEQKLTDSIGNAVIKLPKNFFIDYAGSFYVNTIDKLKIGTLAEDNVHYKVVMNDDKESFGDANLFLIHAPEDKFDLKRYLTGKKFTVVDQDANSFHAVLAAYNDEKKKAEITTYISFKHVYKNGLHIVYLSEDDLGATDPVALAKRHYVLMKNLIVK